MDYRARFYSPYLMRFVQPDTLIPDPSNPQAWNRFAYGLNNPVNFNDPTGHCVTGLVLDTIICADIIIAAVVVTVVAEATIYYVNNTPQGRTLRDQAAEGIMQMGKRRDPKQLTMNKIYANSGENAESSNSWWPEKGIPCFRSARELLTCGILVGGVAKIGYDLLKYGDISSPEVTTATSTPTSTPAPTATATGCPPYNSCPNTQTATATSVTTLTPTIKPPLPKPTSKPPTIKLRPILQIY